MNRLTIKKLDRSLLNAEYAKLADLEDIEIIEKDLDDFNWLKSKLNLTFLNSLPDVEDKIKLMEIMGMKYDR